MIAKLLWFLAGVLSATSYFLLKNRRRTPYLELDLDRLPELASDLRSLAGVTGGHVTSGNRCEVLQNGELYPAMIDDIESARQTIHFESFVWSAGELESQFTTLLARKAREGVTVRLLIDAMGGMKASSHCLRTLENAGVEVNVYCRPHWWNLRRFNHRTHRKLLIVDGKVGFTFGHGIADQWLGDAQDCDHWRDTAVRIEGPAVQALQAVFFENWIEESHCVPAGDGCFPVLDALGDPSGSACDAHVVSSASGDAISAVSLLYTLAIASARREVIIQNPYFAPDDGVCELLAMMVKRGVVVHLMVPGQHTDSPFVRRAGCHLYAGLLEAGVRLYEFEPTLLHQKILIVDGIWSHIGSTNFDARSLALNEEVGVGIRSAEIAAQLKGAFQNDLKRSHELSLAEWRKRPLHSKIFEWVAYRVHDQL